MIQICIREFTARENLWELEHGDLFGLSEAYVIREARFYNLKIPEAYDHLSKPQRK